MGFKVLIWGTGKQYNDYYNLIRFYEKRGDFIVVGVTNNEKLGREIDGYRHFFKEKVKDLLFDYCLVAVTDFTEIREEAKLLGVDEKKLIPIRVLSIPGFDFDNYIRIKESNLSIISRNCWGGICYHYFGLEFLSPTINLFFSDVDFNKMVNDLDYYLSLEVEYADTGYDKNLNRVYPIGKIDDITIHFNHYLDL